MKRDKRSFIILSKHRRLKRLWQFFFTGWGLVMVAVLIAAPIFTKQLLWVPISAINMTDIVSNQFKMSNASFAGFDKNNEPFKIFAKTARQQYANPDVILLDFVNGTVNSITNGQKVTNDISANSANYNRKKKILILTGNVKVYSSNGDKVFTDELVIEL